MQLDELRGAVRSPVAAIEDEDDILTGQRRERDRLARRRLEREIGSLRAGCNPGQVGRR